MISRSRLGTGLGIAAALAAAFPVSGAQAFEIGVQDQGATDQALRAVSGALGARAARVIVRAGEDPQVDRVRAYRAMGLQVQAAITVKRWTTPGDIRATIRAWDGAVGTVSIGNEPELNGLHACTYARLYTRSYRLVRREFPGVRVGIREASPFDVIPYTERMGRCQSIGRIRADFYGIHPYCPDGDPLAPCKTQFQDGYTGIGDLARVKRYLRSRDTRSWLSTPRGNSLPIRVTELSYFPDRGRPEWAWPRAVRQARKHAEQLVIYGFGPVHSGSRWPSAALLDAEGKPTVVMHSLLRSLGRRWPLEPVTETEDRPVKHGPDPHGEGTGHPEPVPEPPPAPEEEPEPVETPPETPVEAPLAP